jgi:hypothetical protein
MIAHVHHKSAVTPAVVFREIGHFGLDGFQDLLDLRPDARVANGSVERSM